MGIKTGIAWTDHTWNPWRGCRKVSAGCRNCYMFRDQLRYGKDPREIVRAAPKTFLSPHTWNTKQSAAFRRELVFTCSWSDFFIEDADAWRADAWDIIRNTPNLIYQILTKRINNVPSRLPDDWPLPNVWLGVTAENQRAADMRIPALLAIPAAKRFISAEPLLSPIDFRQNRPVTTAMRDEMDPKGLHHNDTIEVRQPLPPGSIDQIIVGGESGPGARRPLEFWIRNILDQCDQMGIPFFFKQWGGTKKIDGVYGGNKLDGKCYMEFPEGGKE